MEKFNDIDMGILVEDIEKINSIINSCVQSIYNKDDINNTAYILELCSQKLVIIKESLDKSLH